MERISIPFMQLKECFLKGIDLKALGEINIDEAIQLLEFFVLLSWSQFFPREPKINKDKKIEEDKGCVSYTIRLDFEGNTHQECSKILEKCVEFANKVDIILKPYKQRIRINILCDSCEIFNEQNKKIITTVISDRMFVTDFLAIEVHDKKKIINGKLCYLQSIILKSLKILTF